MKKILYLLIVLLFTACSQTVEKTYWVNSLMVNCVGVSEMKCLEIQKSEQIESGKWEYMYSGIEGFEFEEGYQYKLLVEAQQIPKEDVPADGSSIKYTLVKMLEKNRDNKFGLHDIWALEAIDAEEVDRSVGNLPDLEINLTENRVMGSDGCNRFVGKLEMADGKNVKFGNLAGTRKACKDMARPNSFNQAMMKVASYKVENLKLHLYNKSKKEVLRFRKVD
ncbi:MAG: heat shock protein HslJ [Flammeovirgaceae bacterium]|jgi:heat shock protein HslJ